MSLTVCVPVDVSPDDLRKVRARTGLKFALVRAARQAEEKASPVNLENVRGLRSAERKAKALHDAWCATVSAGGVA